MAISSNQEFKYILKDTISVYIHDIFYAQYFA